MHLIAIYLKMPKKKKSSVVLLICATSEEGNFQLKDSFIFYNVGITVSKLFHKHRILNLEIGTK